MGDHHDNPWVRGSEDSREPKPRSSSFVFPPPLPAKIWQTFSNNTPPSLPPQILQLSRGYWER